MILQKLAPFRFYVQRREAVRMLRVYDVEVFLRYGGYFSGENPSGRSIGFVSETVRA